MQKAIPLFSLRNGFLLSIYAFANYSVFQLLFVIGYQSLAGSAPNN